MDRCLGLFFLGLCSSSLTKIRAAVIFWPFADTARNTIASALCVYPIRSFLCLKPMIPQYGLGTAYYIILPIA